MLPSMAHVCVSQDILLLLVLIIKLARLPHSTFILHKITQVKILVVKCAFLDSAVGCLDGVHLYTQPWLLGDGILDLVCVYGGGLLLEAVEVFLAVVGC